MSEDLRADFVHEIAKAHKSSQSVLLRGPIGTGRAQYIYAADKQTGRKDRDRLSIAGSPALTLEDFWGGMVSGRDGPAWRDGILATAMRSGRRILIHDVDQLPPRLRTVLIDKLEGRSGYQGEGQPELAAKPGFGIDAVSAGTMDPKLAGAFAVRLTL